MPIILPDGLTSSAIRVLQEFRRLNAESLPAATIQGIKHPAGGGMQPAVELAQRGYLAADGEEYRITQKGKDFLAIEAVPQVEGTSDAAASAAENPAADGV